MDSKRDIGDVRRGEGIGGRAATGKSTGIRDRAAVKRVGVLFILFTTVIWATETVLAKLAFPSHSTEGIVQTFTVRALFAMLVTLIYAAVLHRSKIKSAFLITGREFRILFWISILGTALGDLMYYYALTKIPVINAVVIGQSQPIFIVIIGYFMLKTDKLNKYDYAGIALMILAALMVTSKKPENISLLKFGSAADILLVLGTIVWAISALLMRKYLTGMEASVAAFYRFAISAVLFAFACIWIYGLKFANIYQALVGVLVGIGTIFYYEGLKRLKAAQVGALELVTPFFAALLGIMVLGEDVALLQGLGLLFLIPGVYFLSKKEERHDS